MLGLEKIAAWWDEQYVESQEALDEFVTNNDGTNTSVYGRSIIATAAYTSMTLGAGLVDILRIGEGVKEGGWGYAKDGLRILALAGPVVKLGRLGLAKWTYNPPGGICASVAAAQALRQTGNRLFISVYNVLISNGVLIPKNMNQLIPCLIKLGAKTKDLGVPKNVDALKTLTQTHKKSVILFGVAWKSKGHALYAYRNSFGSFRIADRTGKIVKSLSELENKYKGIGSASFQGSAVAIKNAVIVEGSSLASMVAIEVNAYLFKDSRTKEIQIYPVKN